MNIEIKVQVELAPSTLEALRGFLSAPAPEAKPAAPAPAPAPAPKAAKAPKAQVKATAFAIDDVRTAIAQVLKAGVPTSAIQQALCDATDGAARAASHLEPEQASAAYAAVMALLPQGEGA